MTPAQLRFRVFDEDQPVKVSICCITYNHADFIKDCIEGFLDQVSDFRIEIVIYDDASTDGTQDIVREYATKHPTIFRAFLQAENLFSKGVNPYYSFVFPAAKGEFIAICDGDDFWSDPSKLDTQVSILMANPEVALTYGRARAITDNGTIEDFVNGIERDVSSLELKAGCPINTLTTCFRNVFKSKPAPEFLRNSPIGDLTVWGILGYYGSGMFLESLPKANYRIHDGGILSKKPKNKQIFMAATAYLTLAAYHSHQGDFVASTASLRNVKNRLNSTKLVRFIDVKRLKNLLHRRSAKI